MTLQSDLAVAWFRDGLSYLKIARRLASEHGITVSRNAVAGYINRARARGLDIPCRMEDISARAKVKDIQAQAKPKRKARPPIQGVEPTATPEPPREYTGPRGALAINGLNMQRTACCWPIGDPLDAEFRYCCLPAEGRYCPEHTKLGTQTRSERRANMDRYKQLIKKRSRYA